MSDESPEVGIPEDDAAVVEMLPGDATEQEKDVAIAQAELVDDL